MNKREITKEIFDWFRKYAVSCENVKDGKEYLFFEEINDGLYVGNDGYSSKELPVYLISKETFSGFLDELYGGPYYYVEF